jgi:hypothetical protein
MSITTNGLVFYLDPSNTKKSYKGAPTTNLLTSTEDFTVWSQFNTNTVTADQALAPNNTFTADKVVNTTAGTSSVYRDAAGVGTSTAALSVYIKPINATSITFICWFVPTTAQGFSAVFDMLTGQLSSTTGTSASIENVGNGWYRLKLVCTGTNAANNTVRLEIYTPTVGFSYYVWGAQIELNSYVTPYGSRSTTQAFLDITGNTTLTAAVTYAADGSFSFNGTSDKLLAATPVNLPIGSSNRTMICWCKPDTTQVNADAYTGLIAYGARSASGGALLSINTSGATFYVTSAYWANDYTPSTLVVNKAAWNMIAVTTLGDGVANNTTLYCGNSAGINSVTGNSSSYATPLNLASTNLTIGSTEAGGGRWFKGSIGAAMIYNRQLSLAELNQIFYATKARYGL